jgi:hypothetical protein
VDRTEIADRLYGAAEAAARAQHFRLGDGADQDLRKLAAEAADRILDRSKRTEEDLAILITIGVTVFERVVKEMIGSAKRIEGYTDRQPGILGEQTLQDAMLRFCPLWPIC